MNGSSYAKSFVLTTWAFWFIFSLQNWRVLGILVFPPFGVFFTEVYGPYWWLLKLPLLAGLILAIPVTFWLIKRDIGPKRAALTANLCFLLVFAIVAGNIRADAMQSALEGKKPDCFFRRSFLGSVGIPRNVIQDEIHAVAVVDGKVLLWSHKLQNFYEVGERLYRNLHLYNCGPFLPVKSNRWSST